ncbi:hypothetical protein VNO80_21173 [Phaseolus coccineus]|uniref:Uncharacterized protein n=1 Tax=Phaseolus coccineus TaxID=3886 RepID=A0AAN9M1Y7_PHACN
MVSTTFFLPADFLKAQRILRPRFSFNKKVSVARPCLLINLIANAPLLPILSLCLLPTIHCSYRWKGGHYTCLDSVINEERRARKRGAVTEGFLMHL